MPSKPKLNDRVNKLTHQNQAYFLNFSNSIQGKGSSTQVIYKSSVLRFLEHINVTPTEEMPDVIKNYIVSIKNVDTRINTIAAIKSFTENSDFPKIGFDIDDLRPAITKKPDDVEDGRPLSIAHIVVLRKQLNSEEKYDALFVFEMLYLYGITWTQFEKINSANYSKEKGSLSFGSDKTIKLSGTLRKLLSDHPELLTQKKRVTLSGYIKNAGKSLGRRLTETDIEATREKYFPICQICNEKFPNTDEFWALIESKNDVYQKKWLVCIECANKMGGE